MKVTTSKAAKKTSKKPVRPRAKKRVFSGAIARSAAGGEITLEQALFKTHPEFRTDAPIRAEIIAPGKMLLSIKAEEEYDPVIAAFLDFIDHDIEKNPHHVQPLDQAQLDRMWELIKDVEISDDDVLPDDFRL